LRNAVIACCKIHIIIAPGSIGRCAPRAAWPICAAPRPGRCARFTCAGHRSAHPFTWCSAVSYARIHNFLCDRASCHPLHAAAFMSARALTQRLEASESHAMWMVTQAMTIRVSHSRSSYSKLDSPWQPVNISTCCCCFRGQAWAAYAPIVAWS
jgi:hypothetical protein